MEIPDLVELDTAVNFSTEELSCAVRRLLGTEEFWSKIIVASKKAIQRQFHTYGLGLDIKESDIIITLIDRIEEGSRKCPRSMPINLFFMRNIYYIADDFGRDAARRRETFQNIHDDPDADFDRGDEDNIDPRHIEPLDRRGSMLPADEEIARKILFEKLYNDLSHHQNAQKIHVAKYRYGLTGRAVEEETGLTELQVKAAEKAIKRQIKISFNDGGNS